jgi:hypothetical protein
MTANAPDLIAALCAVRGLNPEDLPESHGHGEAMEARISQVAESYDHETGAHRRLGPRRRSW